MTGQQIELFAQPTRQAGERPRARKRDAQTSHDAARRAASFVAGHEATCYQVICDAAERGATARDIERVTAGTPHALTFIQVNRRLGKLGEKKLITRRLRDEPTSPTDYQQRNRSAIWWRK